MKNFIFYTGLATIAATITFLLLGKIELTTFGTINATVLSVLYGWYQKLNNNELTTSKLNLEDEVTTLKRELVESLKETQNYLTLYRESEAKRDKELKAYQLATENLRKGFDSEKEVAKETPKRTRKTKK